MHSPLSGMAVPFKPNILELLSVAETSIENVERFSLKYVDIMSKELGKPSTLLNMDLQIGSHRISDETFQIRVEIPTDKLLHVIQVTSEVTAVMGDGKRFTGLATDVDTIVMTPGATYSQLAGRFS